MDPKDVLIVVPGSDGSDARHVRVPEGATARDVMQQADLSGFGLRNPNGGAFAWNDVIFPNVANGQKLEAFKTDVVAG